VAEYRGHWWLAAAPDEELPGVLTWAPGEHPLLEVEGHFGTVDPTRLFGMDADADAEHEIILGRTSDGTDITCVQCLNVGRSVSLGGSGSGYERFSVRRGALIGRHCASPDEAVFTGFEVSVAHLSSWFPWTGLRDAVEVTPDGQLSRQSVTYEYPKQTFEGRFGRTTVKARPIMRSTASARRRTIEEHVVLSLTYDEAVTPWEAEATEVEGLRMLITLATLHRSPLERMSVDIAEERLAGETTVEWTRECEWLSQRPIGLIHEQQTPNGGEVLYLHEMLFTAQDWPPEARGPTLAAWSEMYRMYALTCNVVAEDIGKEGTAVDSRLLLLARAAEALHRRKYPVPDDARAAHQVRMERLRDLVTDSRLWQWVGGLLRRAYEPSFEARVRRLLLDVQTAVSELIPSSDFCGEFARHRNAYTHEDPDVPSKPKPLDTFKLAVQAQFLLVAWLLVEMGFSQDEVHGFLARNATYKHYVSSFSDIAT
jgi:hypothetical protein